MTAMRSFVMLPNISKSASSNDVPVYVTEIIFERKKRCTSNIITGSLRDLPVDSGDAHTCRTTQYTACGRLKEGSADRAEKHPSSREGQFDIATHDARWRITLLLLPLPLRRDPRE